MKVVLPDPEGPTRKTNSPLSISMLQSLSATVEPLYVLVTFWNVIIGAVSQLERERTERRIHLHPCYSPATRKLVQPSWAPLTQWSATTGPSVAAATLLRPTAQLGFDEHVEISVKHRLDIAGLRVVPQVLDQLIRSHHVGADLIAPCIVGAITRQLVEGRLMLGPLPLGELRPEHLHRLGLVLVLTALVLAGHVLEERNDVEGGEARLPPVLRISPFDAHQAVHAPLGGQQSERIPALDDEGGRQQSGLLSRGRLLHLDVEAAPLRPTGVHAQHHLRPVLRVRAARTGMDLGNRVAIVVVAGEQGPQLQCPEAAVEVGQHLLDLDRRLGALE